jgi:hypothetical protein
MIESRAEAEERNERMVDRLRRTASPLAVAIAQCNDDAPCGQPIGRLKRSQLWAFSRRRINPPKSRNRGAAPYWNSKPLHRCRQGETTRKFRTLVVRQDLTKEARVQRPRQTISPSHPPRGGPGAPAEPDLRRAYTINECTHVLGVSRSTINKMIKQTMLRTLKACSTRLVTRYSVEELLAGDQ